MSDNQSEDQNRPCHQVRTIVAITRTGHLHPNALLVYKLHAKEVHSSILHNSGCGQSLCAWLSAPSYLLRSEPKTDDMAGARGWC